MKCPDMYKKIELKPKHKIYTEQNAYLAITEKHACHKINVHV